MNEDDRKLGMGADIARRDILHGMGATIGAALVGGFTAAGKAAAATAQQTMLTNYDGPIPGAAAYPPLREGMRGSHPGSFEAAHARRDGKPYPDPIDTHEKYDLVVVGGGLSGLAAAVAFRRDRGPDATVLVLDNHDDFGGHAKRNEFKYKDFTFVTTGGSAYFVAPGQWTEDATEFARSLGVDARIKRPHYSPYKAFDMGVASYIAPDIGGDGKLYKGERFTAPSKAFLKKAKMPERVRRDLMKVYHPTEDYLPGMSAAQKVVALEGMSYEKYLLDHVKVEKSTLPWLPGVWCLSKSACSAWFAYFRYAPGFDSLKIERAPDSPESPKSSAADYHLPAGNSDLARLMVRELVPGSLPQGTWQEIELEHVKYDMLDRPNQKARIRVSSIAVRVQHQGEAPKVMFEPDERTVSVDYMHGGKCYRVIGENVILAGNNNMIPYLCPELPDAQKAALHKAVRAANQTTSVLIRDWTAMHKAGVTRVDMPKSFYAAFSLTTPWAKGDSAPKVDPSQPGLLTFSTGTNSGILNNETMTKAILGAMSIPAGATMKDQFRMVRMGLLQTPFETFERAVRTQLKEALGPYGFDPARDIVGITVNRWPHGFAMADNSLFDPKYPPGEAPCEIARKPFGKIKIANSDASGQDLCNTAIDMGLRAVRETAPRRYGYFKRI